VSFCTSLQGLFCSLRTSVLVNRTVFWYDMFCQLYACRNRSVGFCSVMHTIAEPKLTVLMVYLLVLCTFGSVLFPCYFLHSFRGVTLMQTKSLITHLILLFALKMAYNCITENIRSHTNIVLSKFLWFIVLFGFSDIIMFLTLFHFLTWRFVKVVLNLFALLSGIWLSSCELLSSCEPPYEVACWVELSLFERHYWSTYICIWDG